MKKLDKKNIIRLIAVIIFLAVSITATILLIPFVKGLTTEAGRLAIKEKADAFGPLGWVLFLGLQLLQVIVAFIPGEPIEILSGVLFGAFGGMFLCLIGIMLGTIAVYYLVKAVGKPLVFAFVPEEKFEHFKIFQDEKKLEVLIFILFLIPGTPKDTLTYIVPLTKVKPLKFFLLSTLARIPSVIGSTIIGRSIGNGNWFLAVWVFVIAAAIGLVGIFFNDKLIYSIKEKHKKQKDV